MKPQGHYSCRYKPWQIEAAISDRGTLLILSSLLLFFLTTKTPLSPLFSLHSTNMGSLVYRGFILLVCIGFLSLQPQNVSGLRSIDLVLRWDKEVLPAVRNTRILKAVPLKDLQMNPSLAPAPSLMFDPNQSNKRKVRKGSDPIHNRCWTWLKLFFHTTKVRWGRVCPGKAWLVDAPRWMRKISSVYGFVGFLCFHPF